MITESLNRQIEALKQQGLYRQRLASDESGRALNFSSNDYLSLRNDERIKSSFEKGFNKYPAGSGASVSVGGYHSIHQELEQYVASQLGVDDALLFSSGYAANLGIMALLTRLNCHLLIDKAVHASTYDGIKLANAGYTRFLHNNYDDLSSKIASSLSGPSVVITEGIFSMSGQQPDLTKIASLGSRHQSICIVDEAHSFGVLGEDGLGAVHQHGLSQEEVPLRLITFGKALGFQGALVAGKGAWIDGLFQSSRSHLYTTAMSPAVTYGLLESFIIMSKANDRRKKLFQLINHFQQTITKSPLRWRKSSTPIQQLQLGCPHKALHYAYLLKQNGIHCHAIREPTVSRRETGLRIVLNFQHEEQDIDNLFHQLHLIYESDH
ncbi:MAG: aminotransferase class I/II-fold pyridoxal phosphate-dependent enzyme [Legionella sp.]|nr:aminotransferase class I/II-fold pyridoxal phosphate-dependent enzyme [Legionella sp.]